MQAVRVSVHRTFRLRGLNPAKTTAAPPTYLTTLGATQPNFCRLLITYDRMKWI